MSVSDAHSKIVTKGDTGGTADLKAFPGPLWILLVDGVCSTVDKRTTL